MKFYLVKLVTNTEGADAPSIVVYTGDDAESNALVAYHNALAAYHNAPDVLYAVCSVLNEMGDSIIKEIVDHKPHPEPTPVTIVSITKDGNTYTVLFSDGTSMTYTEE